METDFPQLAKITKTRGNTKRPNRKPTAIAEQKPSAINIEVLRLLLDVYRSNVTLD